MSLDWRIDKYYISRKFEVIQYKGCRKNNILVGVGNNYDDALNILAERNKDCKLVDQRKIGLYVYYHYFTIKEERFEELYCKFWEYVYEYEVGYKEDFHKDKECYGNRVSRMDFKDMLEEAGMVIKVCDGY
jgi:hypothetical protein